MSCALPPNVDSEDRRAAVLAVVWHELYRYLRARVRHDLQLVEDLMQEAAADFTDAWRTSGEMSESQAIAVLKNSAAKDLIDTYRKTSRRRTDPVAFDEDELLLAYASSRVDTSDEITALLSRITVEQMLAALDERDREVLTLIYVDGFTKTAAAAHIGISTTGLDIRLKKATQRLRRHLQAQPEPTRLHSVTQAPRETRDE